MVYGIRDGYFLFTDSIPSLIFKCLNHARVIIGYAAIVCIDV
ncbi:MAG: hypothetical protein ACI9KN_001634, partial [Gammaproteobacteria bacterium]